MISSVLARIFRVVRLSVLLGGCAAAAGAWAVLRPDLMVVERVVFEGQNHATAAELRHLADLPNGTRIWEVDTDVVARAVERHPWVARATVTRNIDRTVTVQIAEHQPVALVHTDRPYYVAVDGTVFLPASGDDLDYPSITGITPVLEGQHPDLPRLVVRDALALIDSLDARGLIPADQIDEVHFAPSRGFTVMTGRARVLFSLYGTSGQLDRLQALLGSGRVDLGQPLHVDLGPATVAIVRPLTPGGA